MRFFPIAISALMASAIAGASVGKKTLTGADLNSMVANGEIDQEFLMRHAKAVSRRHLNNNYNYNNANNNNNAYGGNGNYQQWNNGQGYNNYNGANNMYNYNQNNDNNEGGYSGNGYYNNVDGYENNNANNNVNEEKEENDVPNPVGGNLSIRFNTCMSFKVEDPDLLNDETLLDYAKDGTIIAQESYVLFDIQHCLPGNCVFNENNLNNVYMVPLPVFLESMVYYYPNRREEYCDACQDFYDYCTTGDGIYYDTAVYANGGHYCYEGDYYELIDCHKCRSYSCYTNNNFYAEEENIETWFEQITQCHETETNWKGYDLYGGLMCNQDGSGVEFGVFADANCRYYHTGKNYQKVMSQDDFYYYGKAPEVVEFMFTNSISCMSSENTNYISAYQEVYGSEACQESDLMNSNCQSILGQYYTLPLGSCQSSNYNSSTAVYVENSDYDSHDWMRNGPYTPQVSYEAQQNPTSVCNVVKQTYKYADLHKNVYDERRSGKMFAYNEDEDDMDKKQKHLSMLDVFGLIVLATVIGALAFLAIRRYNKSKDRQEVAFEDGTTGKQLPLIQ